MDLPPVAFMSIASREIESFARKYIAFWPPSQEDTLSATIVSQLPAMRTGPAFHDAERRATLIADEARSF